MFDADRPITSAEQDRLGRKVFAVYLARCILDHQIPDSLVIGLYGASATGKTSLINLVLEELRFASSNMLDEDKPVILNFSPWSYSGQNQLIYGFFRRLSSELRQFPYLENSAEIIHLLELYVSFFTNHPVPRSLRIKRKLLAKLKKPIVNKQESYAWESGRDPTQVKAELNELLKAQKHKIIIMIDNISRLIPKEINQILQIVKSMGDYANTVYLLAFDKEQTVAALDKIHPGEGNEYVEKLVQLPFDVPPISKQDLESLLFDRLKNVIVLAPEDSWSTSYWADIYYATLKYFFTSCRDITRYVNALSFSYPRVKDVVNPVDFFALTALEVFAPQIFYGVRDNKDLFTDLLDNVYQMDVEQVKKDKQRCDEILNRNTEVNPEILQYLLMHLFPRLRNIYRPAEQFYHSEQLARENRRICSPDIFDVYFRMSIPTGYMPESELMTILKQAGDTQSFDQALARLNQDNRVTKFLDLLDSTAAAKIPNFYIGNVINALLDDGDLFPEGETDLLSFNTPMRIHRICHQLLHTLPDTEKRFAILRDAIINANKSIYIVVHELMAQNAQHLESEDTFLPIAHRDVTPDQLHQLKDLAVTKIKYWAQIQRLAEHPKLLPILFAWQRWGVEEDCKTYLRQLIADDRGLLAFLGAALKDPIMEAKTNQEKNPDWKKSLDNITYFLPVSEVEPYAKAIFENEDFEKLREEEQLSVLIFLDLINAQTVKVIPNTAAGFSTRVP
jgi:predicted KAP-like P-loop ATPase